MLLLGLGSNLSSNFGNRFENIDLAISYFQSYKIQLLKKEGVEVKNNKVVDYKSKLYEFK